MLAAIDALDNATVARVSLDLPLRANLSALDNVGLIPLYQRHCGALDSARQAQALLDGFAHGGIALLRDPDMTAAQRFVVKLARAVILRRARIVIDRPGAMLYDVDYPDFIRQLADCDVADGQWQLYDYDWNRAHYPADMTDAAHE
jgi:ABC-type sugar transport system ATPase subunit